MSLLITACENASAMLVMMRSTAQAYCVILKPSLRLAITMAVRGQESGNIRLAIDGTAIENVCIPHGIGGKGILCGICVLINIAPAERYI